MYSLCYSFYMKSSKRFATPLTIALVGLVLVGGVVFIYAEIRDPNHGRKAAEMMALTLYVQDKEAARTKDCGVTIKETRLVPKTTAVADTSLKMLFASELSQYGTYKSVSISNGIAKVELQNNKTASGNPISSLSSCEIIHLTSVLNTTLTQYPTINSVELYSPEGKIEF